MDAPTSRPSTGLFMLSASNGRRRSSMRVQRLMMIGVAAALGGSFVFAQPGRGGSQWLTALGDAQRTSWLRADDKISVAALSKAGFDQQWKVQLDNQPRGL